MSTETLTRLIISGIFIVAYIVVMVAWIWTAHPQTDDKVAPALIGVMTAGVLTILNYWFGKSSPA